MFKRTGALAAMSLMVIFTVSVGAETLALPTTFLPLEGSGWTVAADPDNMGKEEAWWTGPRLEAVPVRVPGIFQEALPAYHGVAWYWREFTPPANPYEGGHCLLRFHAIDYLADVWLNDTHVGSHEGGETPFTLDITEALLSGQMNRLAVRVLNPTAEPIDGVILSQTPHRNKGASGIVVGGSYNSGGIIEPVELFWTPAVRVEDVFVRPDWNTGLVRVQTTVINASPAPVKGLLQLTIAPALGNHIAAKLEFTQNLPMGSSAIESELKVENHRLWQLDDPFLYRLITRVAPASPPESSHAQPHAHFTRFGFRDFRVEKGYFRLNGKRIFLKSSHTGNHCPVGAILPPDSAKDLLRKDLLYAKSCGFNMIRFIAGMAHPYQLDLCDEIGLMVYEENMSGWCMEDSPAMAQRFDFSLREMILRDRNHPSLTIFGLMNEVGNGPVVQHAIASLGMLRSLDDTRLILFQSGRWDGQYNVGSVSNPGSTHWEHVWGVESPEFTGTAGNGPWGGYFTGAGDAHVYPGTPHTPEIEAGIRNLGSDSKPVFLSEYGIGSLMNAIRELRYYEQHGANPEWDDYKYFKQTEEKLTAAWTQLGMEGVYAFPEEMLRASQELHGRQRLLGFNLIRSNPKICGYNLTGILDHGYTGEGLWTFWREFKPGIADVLQDGFSPLRWCLFAAPMHGYTDRPVKVEVVLATEDALRPGTYPAFMRILGPDGIAWERKTEVTVPAPAAGEDGPLSISVFAEDVLLTGPGGKYTLAITLERGGAPAGGRLAFYLSEPPRSAQQVTVAGIQMDPRVTECLAGRGVTVVPLDNTPADTRHLILIGDMNDSNTDTAARTALLERVARGSVAVFLKPEAFQKGDTPLGWLPIENKGGLTHFSDWLYHKECVAKKHAFFNGLQSRGVMDWDYYGPIITNKFFEGGDIPEDMAAAAFAVCHSSRPDGFAAGVMLGAYSFGAGKIIVNTFNILDNIDRHPAADRMLLNMIEYALTSVELPSAALPVDFASTLTTIGY
ncbi:MAG: hypothetical protein GXY07_05965 [Candidatus Hydrogenedentes bacterium]|nr:hypothetical protein [Candidatus Hydrogenedentota bacterium]